MMVPAPGEERLSTLEGYDSMVGAPPAGAEKVSAEPGALPTSTSPSPRTTSPTTSPRAPVMGLAVCSTNAYSEGSISCSSTAMCRSLSGMPLARRLSHARSLHLDAQTSLTAAHTSFHPPASPAHSPAPGRPAFAAAPLSSAARPDGAAMLPIAWRMAASSLAGSPGAEAAVLSVCSASSYLALAAPSALSALSKAPYGSATEEGTLMPGGRAALSAASPLLLPPTEALPTKSLSGMTQDGGGMGGWLRCTRGAPPPPLVDAPPAGSAAVVMLTPPSCERRTSAKPPAMPRIASSAALSRQLASSTPWPLARMAMWLRMSVMEAEITATTPCGTSSSPPS
mmetsp:Transcript_20346/g.53208  ORF Transcript_20346/g.53208 Transcript_20346/m.53208 type:complete len:340 (-) Transcript_20346:480-1499(-)